MKLLIVGGGTAGWMTASYLSKAFTDVDITLIESGVVKTVGVGEATFSTLKLFFDFLDLRESDWMPHCSAGYKLAIRFQNWTKEKTHFYHPFQRYETAGGMTAAEWWLKLRNGEPFDYSCFVTPHICDAMRSPRFFDGTVYDEEVQDYFDDGKPVPNAIIVGHKVQYPYAYHFNAAELALYLQGYATGRGVKRIVDDVTEVALDEQGNIAGVHTRDSGFLAADLYVDCTGFRGLLINKALNEPFISFNDTLLNDSAIAIQVPRDVEKVGMKPYTTAHALDAGWSWNIPLYGRDGTGYVYCSQFASPDEAEREFREFLGPDAKDCAASHIKMRIGRSRDSWVKNCVAIGLSSGFVEPLESTGIFFIQHGIEELVNHFPREAQVDPNMARSYNQTINQCIDGVRQFLTIHYCAGDRDDTPYWVAARNVPLPEELAERMRIWKARLPGIRNIYPSFHGFEAYSWSVMLLGLNYEPDTYLAALDYLDEGQAKEMFAQIRRKAEFLVRSLPSQYEYLTHIRQERPALAV
ncbi:MAG: tryptophan halogenase family protein [Longimicrobiaceae bacterium]